MSNTMVTTAEHTIPVEGRHFNRARQIPEQPEVGVGEVFLSTFNVPKAIQLVFPSASAEFFIRFHYENSEPGEKTPRETEELCLTLARNSKKIIEMKLPRSSALLEGNQIPQIPESFVEAVGKTLEGSQHLVFSMSATMTNAILHEIWPRAIKHLASRGKAAE